MPTYEIFGLRRKYLRTVTYQLRNPSTGGDGLLPAGWHLLTDWHFTPVILTAAQSAALPMSQQNAGTRANVYARSALNRSGMAFAFPRAWEILRWII